MNFNPGFTMTTSDVMPTTMDSINPMYIHQIADFIGKTGGNLASYYGGRLYDTVRVDAGTLPLKQIKIFQNPVGGTNQLFIAGTTYTVQEIDTTPILDTGKLSKGYHALVWAIGCYVDLTGTADATVQTSGPYINLPLNPGTGTTAAAAGSGGIIVQANTMRAIQESFYMELFINQSRFEHGPIKYFPAGIYGRGQGVSVDGNNFINEGTESNGFGFAYQLPIMRYIPEQIKWGVNLISQNPFLVNVPFRLNMWLEGLFVQPITG